MTISVVSELVYSSQGDGVTTEFTYPVRFEEASELVVISREDGVDTVLTLNTDYTVAGAGLDAGGTVTMLYTPTAAEEIVRYRDTAAKQIVNLADSTRNPAEAVENQLDRFAMNAQDQAERLSRALLARPGSTGQTLPEPEADKIIMWNADGDGLINRTVGEQNELVPGVNVGDIISTNNGSDFADPLEVPGNIGAMPQAVNNPNNYQTDAFESTNHVFNEGGTGAVDVAASALLGDQLASRMFGVVGDGVADDTLAVQAFIDRCIATGKRGILMGTARVTGDLNITGDLDLYGVLNSRIVADGANVVKLDGTLAGATIKFENVGFRDFARSALWIEEGAQIASLSVDKCRFQGNRVAISAEGDRSSPGYAIGEWHGPNPNSKLSQFRVVDSEISDGITGIGVSCIVEDAFVSRNRISDLINNITDGSSLEYAVQGIRIFLDGLPEELSGKYSDFYDLQRRIVITDNVLSNVIQNVASKGLNGIIASGFAVVISDNILFNVYNSNASDPSDGDGTVDSESIYAKAAECGVTDNICWNAGGDQGAINVKGVDISVESVAGANGSPPGRNRLVDGNIIYFDGVTVPHARNAIEVEASPCKVTNNLGFGLKGTAVLVQGEITEGYTFEDVIVTNNLWHGELDTALTVRGGVKSLSYHDNVSTVTGGNGNCTMVDLAQSRDLLWENISIKDNTHRVEARTGATAYNALVRAGVNFYDINRLIIKDNIADHFVAGQENYGVFLQGSAGRKLRGLEMKGNTWPAELSAGRLLYSDNFHVEYDIDERLIITTTSATEVYALNTRYFQNSRAMIEVETSALDLTTGEVAHYHKKGLFRRATGGQTQVGTTATIAEMEDDATWNAVPAAVSNFARISLVGDATNSVRWDVRVKVSVDPI